MDYLKTYQKWLNYERLEDDLKKELININTDPKKIKDRFYKSLEFGTAGLRGVIGAGTNRMNIYTVRRTTQGLANYLKKSLDKDQSVVIAYDSRYKSKEFAEQAALVLANNKIKTYIFNDITATPLLSYAVRELKANAGIVITASHNPKEYNGYKVYTNYGGQITDRIAHIITDEINKIEDALRVEISDKVEAEKIGLLNWLDDEILSKYINKTKELILRQDVIDKVSDNYKIIYTPLHGTGNIPVTRLLKEAGFKNVNVVSEQAVPDPEFPTVKYPNPEEQAVFELALNLAKQDDVEIIMGTDPDADRVGVMARDNSGEYVIITGNQLGALLIDYILQMRQHNHDLPQNGVVIKTIVTSDLGVKIAEKYGINYMNVLTGFKYIGEKMEDFEKTNGHTFIFGYEESYGYLIGDYVRDKDAVQICLAVAEMAAYYRLKGKSLLDRLNQLFDEYGYYKEELVSYVLKGIEGEERIKRILTTLQTKRLIALNNTKILIMKDYLSGLEINLLTDERKPTELPKAKVFHYTLEDGSWFCVRPSGTEPKLKIYFSVVGEDAQNAEQKLIGLKSAVLEMIKEIE